ncbi:hypothetical protein SBV1_1180020 [Verrucomicrobia bacterium]|nr:hypothetical protein SBV1_1180020 [Verrucomicrobiota bacterium]
MGRSYWYECSRCGYRAKVSGRPDRGFNFFVQTIVCRDCKELYDAVTRVKLPVEPPTPKIVGDWRPLHLQQRPRFLTAPPTFQAALNRLLYTGSPRLRWQEFKPQCPVSAKHKVVAWTEADKCPRCGTHLDKSVLPYRIWD